MAPERHSSRSLRGCSMSSKSISSPFSSAKDAVSSTTSIRSTSSWNAPGSSREKTVSLTCTIGSSAEIAYNVGGEPEDYRRAMAAFQVFDLEASQRVFSICGTSTRAFALDEQLRAWQANEPFIYMGESPYEDFDDDFTRLRTCEITLDQRESTASWRVDGHTVYQTRGTFIPERVGIGFGIWTMLPIRDGRTRSLDGQGMSARWRRFRLRRVDA